MILWIVWVVLLTSWLLTFVQAIFKFPLMTILSSTQLFPHRTVSLSFEVMPFGLCNAPSTLQRLMETTLRGLQWKICLIYINDVIIYSKTFSDHLLHLATVFDRLRTAGLKLKSSKCKFGCRTVPYLGFVATPEGIKPDASKVECVTAYPIPTNVKEVRAFLGLSNYYRHFIHSYACICHPLTQLTQKNQPFVWTSECQTAFEQLKETLVSAPILADPDFSAEFILHVDASNTAIGMILSQIQNHNEVVIAYGSRVLS